MDRKNYQALILILCCWLVSCKKDKPEPAYSSLPGAIGNVYVICEGNFTSGDASLYAWASGKDSVFGDIFESVNKQPLGDIFQSMQHIGDKLFLCINNSDKIVVLSSATWQQTGTINIKKPRYILPVSTTKAYISSEYNNKVYIINPQTLVVSDSITFPYRNTEGMCLYNGSAYICVWDTACGKLYQVDIITNNIIREINLPAKAPQEVLIDKEQMLWVLAGDEPYGTTATLSRIDPTTGEVLHSFLFPANANPFKPVLNAAKDTICFLEAYNKGTMPNGVYKVGIHASALPAQPFVADKANQYFYAVGINPANDEIYIADAKDFNQKGTVYIYRPDGTVRTSFNVGSGPGHFYFDN